MTKSEVHQLERFFLANQNKAFLFCQYRGLSEQDSLDIMQDSMLQFYKHYSQKSEDDWAPLFFAVLRNKLIDKQRWLSLQKKLFFWQKPASDTQGDADSTELAESLLAAYTEVNNDVLRNNELVNSENALAHAQSYQKLIDTIKLLPEKQQMVFLLKTINEFSEQQIANVLDVSVGTVKQHYSRAKQQLQHSLGGQDD
jgi:RNA polymerase sigma-70 factor (ECF subfamily)